MKTATALLASLLLAGTLGATRAAMAADGVIYKQELIPGSYCHLKFPAIRGRTRAADDPILKAPSDGDVIDFYGRCDEYPLGSDQMHEQKLDNYHRFQHDYED
jgi:hypothetical protein